MKCSKCESDSHLTDHHIHPVVFFQRKNNNLKVCLCRLCHDKLEFNILSVESYVGNTKFGVRHKLERSDYEKILRNFLGNQTIIYTTS
jgi:hypothetical protein